MIREDRVNRLGRYWQDKYGCKVYKIIVKGDFTCPNLKTSNGCIFCNMSSMITKIEKDVGNDDPLLNQLYLKKRNNAQAFYAYFQDFSATYPKDQTNRLQYLEKIYSQAFELKNIVGVSIGTRSDAIDDDILNLLKKLRLKYQKDLVLEIGLQSILEEDLAWMNRGHDLNNYIKGVKRIQESEIEVVSHLIFGLPHETTESIIQTAKFVNKMNISGVKLHQLMVLKNTQLANVYLQGNIKILSEEEYFNRIGIFLIHLNPNVVIHRLYADAPKSDLIEPKWCANKIALQDKIFNYLVKNDLWQGKNFNL